jgi:hypothetical protein
MIHRFARACIAFALVVVLVLPPPPASACGPYFPVTIFIQTKHPDLPLDKFAAGKLGVLQPSYARSYLVVAYRYLSGLPFDSSEQQQLMALWAHRLDREEEWLKNRNSAYEEWLEARYKFATGSKPAPVKKDDDAFPGYKFSASRYSEFENCAEDAFLTAAKTLQARSKQFGQHSQEVRSWLEAQDTVFHNCGGPFAVTGKLELPEEAPKQLPALLWADRDYQIAAAYFYDGSWTEAEQRFQAIAQDSSSPWQAIAAIVAVRTKLRRITLSEDSSNSSQKDLAAIDAELRNLEKLPSMRNLRPAIWRMRGFVEFRLDPDGRRLEIADIIEHAKHRSTLREDLDDYTLLLDRAIGDDPGEDATDQSQIAAARSFQPSESLRARSPMTDWLLTFQASNQAASDHALSKWKESHSLPWLVACLSKASPGTPNLSELLEAVAAIQPASPAYLTVSFHRARLEAQSGNEGAALHTIETTLAAAPVGDLASALNLFTSLRMKLARNLDEFLQFAPRQGGLITLDVDERDLPDPSQWCSHGIVQSQAACAERMSPPPLFDSDAATVLTESMPTRILAQAAASPRLPENLRRQVAQSAWVRAILLNDEPVARQLVPLLSSLSPDLAPGLKSYIEARGSSLRFAAAFLTLHRPELHPYISAGIGRETTPGHIDNFHDNWWCSFAPTKDEDSWGNYFTMYTHIDGPLRSIYFDKKLDYPNFLTDAETKTAETEWVTLSQLHGAPNWFARQVLDFAKFNPNDHRVIEALHFVVRATRFGCTDANSPRYSKSAFLLLHKRYPHNPWTEKTPYWY